MKSIRTAQVSAAWFIARVLSFLSHPLPEIRTHFPPVDPHTGPTSAKKRQTEITLSSIPLIRTEQKPHNLQKVER